MSSVWQRFMTMKTAVVLFVVMLLSPAPWIIYGYIDSRHDYRINDYGVANNSPWLILFSLLFYYFYIAAPVVISAVALLLAKLTQKRPSSRVTNIFLAISILFSGFAIVYISLMNIVFLSANEGGV